MWKPRPCCRTQKTYLQPARQCRCSRQGEWQRAKAESSSAPCDARVPDGGDARATRVGPRHPARHHVAAIKPQLLRRDGHPDRLLRLRCRFPAAAPAAAVGAAACAAAAAAAPAGAEGRPPLPLFTLLRRRLRLLRPRGPLRRRGHRLRIGSRRVCHWRVGHCSVGRCGARCLRLCL